MPARTHLCPFMDAAEELCASAARSPTIINFPAAVPIHNCAPLCVHMYVHWPVCPPAARLAVKRSAEMLKCCNEWLHKWHFSTVQRAAPSFNASPGPWLQAFIFFPVFNKYIERTYRVCIHTYVRTHRKRIYRATADLTKLHFTFLFTIIFLTAASLVRILSWLYATICLRPSLEVRKSTTFKNLTNQKWQERFYHMTSIQSFITFIFWFVWNFAFFARPRSLITRRCFFLWRFVG